MATSLGKSKLSGFFFVLIYLLKCLVLCPIVFCWDFSRKKLVFIEGFESAPTFIKSFSAVPKIKCAPPKHYIICLRYDEKDISFYDK